jgi:hypothetical protein
MRWTKSGASAETSGGRACVAVTPDGTDTSCKRASVASTASKLRFTISAPRLL